MNNRITKTNLNEFKKLVRKAIFLEHKEEKYFNLIPDEKWKEIFRTNFNGNFNYAQRVILNKYKEIKEIDFSRVEKEHKKIFNLDRSIDMMEKFINSKKPIIFITDFDNDGSLAQSIINEYLKVDEEAAKNMYVNYAQTVNGNSNRGFTVDLVDRIVEYNNFNPDEEFLVVTADNGINSKDEQMKILKKYPKANIIVTDHHNPDPLMCVEDNERTVIFNPHYKPTPFFEEYNISGASTMQVLLKNLLEKRMSAEDLLKYHDNLNLMTKLAKISNLLDYVNTDPADKPERDYIVSKFLELQPLLNINNSISKMITGELKPEIVSKLKEKVPELNEDVLYSETNNIHTQNHIAKILLKIYQKYLVQVEKDKQIELLKASGKKVDEYDINKEIYSDSDISFIDVYLKEIANPDNYIDYDVINPNFIEQLRPLIFSLTADDEKTLFLTVLNDKMIDVFESVRTSERKMANELRKGEVISKSILENSTIMYTDPDVLSIFNRKFLNKVYNDQNNGFLLTLDNIDKKRVSGSFRSLYDISAILKDKEVLEKKYSIKIETPGHEKAAGFIITSVGKKQITEATILAINNHINNAIKKLKEKDLKLNDSYIETSLGDIHLIDRINKVIRGNVSHFARITPVLKLDKNTVWTDAYSTKQYSMEELIQERKYGYITVNTNFHGDTVIVPVEVIRKLVENNYEDYLALNYMDGGVFMVEKILPKNVAGNTIKVINEDNQTKEIAEAFEKHFKDKNHVEFDREQIKDNPFFKYHDYGNLNFDLFERMVIGIIDDYEVDYLTVFDVEANGFGNSKLMNLGSTNYYIDNNSGEKLSKADFEKYYYASTRGEEYLLNDEEINNLVELNIEDMPLYIKKVAIVKNIFNSKEGKNEEKYFIDKNIVDNALLGNVNRLNYKQIKNVIENDDNVIINREIKATMLAYLVKDKDFKVPQEMINLTGINQEILDKYGKETSVVDREFASFYKDKKVIFGAHNTPYDGRVLRANTPLTYNVLKNNKIYDSALFAKEQKLAYDDIKVSNVAIPGIEKKSTSMIYFYDNKYSDFNLSKFLVENKPGYYPDRTGRFLFGIEEDKATKENEYFMIDKTEHEIVKLNTNHEEILNRIVTKEIPNVSIKYSVEKLSEQWMIHALLLSDEKFDIKYVDLNSKPEYKLLLEHQKELLFFQDNYHFDASQYNNLNNFAGYLNKSLTLDEEQYNAFSLFVDDFLELNKEIQQKFADAWMYKKVLSIKDPTRVEVTKDLIDLVVFQTNIPEEKVKEIFNNAIKFKNKYGIDHIIHHESHVNGTFEGDKKGDIVFEDKLTLSLLAQKHYNPYNHSVDNAINQFKYYAKKAQLAFNKADALSTELSCDSYSYRQGLLYDREDLTNTIKTIQDKEASLNSDESIVVKFKLDNDVLPNETHVMAIVRKGISVSREQVEKDSNMLSFILLNEQLNQFSENVTTEVLDTMEKILSANNEKVHEYKKDLSERYRYIEHSRRDSQTTGMLKYFISVMETGKVKKKYANSDLDENAYRTIKNIVVEYMKDNIDSLNTDFIDILAEEFKKYEENMFQTTLEKALEDESIDFKKELNVYDKDNNLQNRTPAFLSYIDISRKNPDERLVNRYSKHKLINNYITKMNEEKLTKKNKIKM